MRMAALSHTLTALIFLAGVLYVNAEAGGLSAPFVRPKECGGCATQGEMELDCQALVEDCLAKEQKRKDYVKDKGEKNKNLPDQTCLDAYMDLACYPAFCCASRATQKFRSLIDTLNNNGCVDKINPVHATVAWKHVSQCSPSEDVYCVGDSECDCAYPKDYIAEVPDCCCTEEFMPPRGCIGSEPSETKNKCADDNEDCNCNGGKVHYVQKYKGDTDPARNADETSDEISFDDIIGLGLKSESTKGSSALSCRADSFGGDPAPGREKVCFCEITSDAIPNCCNKVDTWKTHWCRTPQMCPNGEGETAKDKCPLSCRTSSTSIVGEWTNGYCQALSDDYDGSELEYYSLMDKDGREKHSISNRKAIKSVKYVCLKTARNYDGKESDELRNFFKAEDASMGIFLYEQEDCNGASIEADIKSGDWKNWKEDPYYMRLVLPAAPCVSGTSFITCKYDPEKAAYAGDKEGLIDFSAGFKSSPYFGIGAVLVTLICVHLM